MGNRMSHGNGQVRFDRCDRRPDSMPVFAVGWLGMFMRFGRESGLNGF